MRREHAVAVDTANALLVVEPDLCLADEPQRLWYRVDELLDHVSDLRPEVKFILQQLHTLHLRLVVHVSWQQRHVTAGHDRRWVHWLANFRCLPLISVLGVHHADSLSIIIGSTTNNC